MIRKAFAIGTVGLTIAGLVILPRVGTNADSSSTDSIDITVEAGCTFIARPDDQTLRAVTIGQGAVVKDIEGVIFDITCNGRDFEGTWKLSAAGESQAKMTDGAGHEISSLASELSGEQSNWQMKMNVRGAAVVKEDFLDYAQVPTESTEVASNSGDLASGDAVIQAYYGVSAQASQEAGSYTGKVTYTLTNSASN